MKDKATIKRWNAKCEKELVGKTVQVVRYLTDQEQKQLGWDNKSLVIIFNGGICVFASCDDEGNGAGALFTNIKGLETIPVI
jgi:hypothetical protein